MALKQLFTWDKKNIRWPKTEAVSHFALQLATAAQQVNTYISK